MIMVPHFVENDLFVLGRAFEDDLVIVIQRKHDDLMIGENLLEGLDFAAWSFGDTGNTMEFFGLVGLNRFTSSQIDVARVSTTQVTVGFHDDDGACTTEFVLVHDPDHTLFDIQ